MVWGLGLRVSGDEDLGCFFRVWDGWGFGFRIRGLGVQGFRIRSGFRFLDGLVFRVSSLGFRV